MEKRGNAAPKELVSRAFELWREAGALLRQEEQRPELIEGEGADRWFDQYLNRSIPFSEVAKRGLLPSFRTNTGNLKSTKRVRQVLVDYQQHLKAQVDNTTRDSVEGTATQEDLAAITGALKCSAVPHQLLQKVKGRLELGC